MDKVVKLQNLLFPKLDMKQHFWMFYRGEQLTHNKIESAYCLEEDKIGRAHV